MPYEKYDAWKVAHQLALEIYRITDRWPASERYQLTSQIRRAALSAATNTAEGLQSAAHESFAGTLILREVHSRKCHIFCALARTGELSITTPFSSWMGYATGRESSRGVCIPLSLQPPPPKLVRTTSPPVHPPTVPDRPTLPSSATSPGAGPPARDRGKGESERHPL
jgi:hypothetical protein